MPNTGSDRLDASLMSLAHEVLGVSADAIDVAIRPDATDREAYFVEFRFGTAADRAKASLDRTRLTQRIRDWLIQRGDEKYPHVRLIESRDWGRRRARS